MMAAIASLCSIFTKFKAYKFILLFYCNVFTWPYLSQIVTNNANKNQTFSYQLLYGTLGSICGHALFLIGFDLSTLSEIIGIFSLMVTWFVHSYSALITVGYEARNQMIVIQIANSIYFVLLVYLLRKLLKTYQGFLQERNQKDKELITILDQLD